MTPFGWFGWGLVIVMGLYLCYGLFCVICEGDDDYPPDGEQ